jgi:hypothetical protein
MVLGLTPGALAAAIAATEAEPIASDMLYLELTLPLISLCRRSGNPLPPVVNGRQNLATDVADQPNSL